MSIYESWRSCIKNIQRGIMIKMGYPQHSSFLGMSKIYNNDGSGGV